MQTRGSAPDPRDLLARFRATYRNYFTLSKTAGSVPEGVVVATPSQHPLREPDLPEALRRLLGAYRSEHPQEDLELVKYMRIVNGTPEVVVEDESPIPPEEELLTLSETVTLNTSDRVEVITELFVARRL